MTKLFAVLPALFAFSLMAQEGSYSYYNCFMDEPTLDGYYGDGYHFGGPYRANGPVVIYSSSPGRDNDIFFYSFTLSSDHYVYGPSGSGPHVTVPHYENLWIEPYENMEQGPPWFNLGVDPLPFGADQVEWQIVRAAAMNYGLYLTTAEVPDGSRILLEDGQISVKTEEYSTPVVYLLSDLAEPVVWIENSANDLFYLKGHPDSQGLSEDLTIGSQGSIYFAGPLEYNGDSPGMLGLVSVFGDGVIADKPDSDWDPPFHIETEESFVYSASLLLLEGELVAENYSQPRPAVNFTMYGGMQLQAEGYTSSGIGGFNIFPEYDERLFNQSPPWYPQYEMSGIETAGTLLPGLELSASCNPFFSTVALTMSQAGTMSVFDSTGRIVGSCETEGDWEWNGSSLPQGVYVFVAEGVSGESSSLKLIKL